MTPALKLLLIGSLVGVQIPRRIDVLMNDNRHTYSHYNTSNEAGAEITSRHDTHAEATAGNGANDGLLYVACADHNGR